MRILFFLLLNSLIGGVGLRAQTQGDTLWFSSEEYLPGLIVREWTDSLVQFQAENFQLYTFADSQLWEIRRAPLVPGYWEEIETVDGRVSRGFLLSYTRGMAIRLEGTDGRVYDLAWRKLYALRKMAVPNDSLRLRSESLAREGRKRDRGPAWEPGRSFGHFFFEAGPLIALAPGGTSQRPGFYAYEILAYNFRERVSLGLGLGQDLVFQPEGEINEGRTALADLRLFFPQEKHGVPYLLFQGGYDWFRNGFWLSTGIGLRYPLWRYRSLNLRFGFRYQEVSAPTNNVLPLANRTEMLQIGLVID
jgi:hypothetical protein